MWMRKRVEVFCDRDAERRMSIVLVVIRTKHHYYYYYWRCSVIEMQKGGCQCVLCNGNICVLMQMRGWVEVFCDLDAEGRKMSMSDRTDKLTKLN
jgi:hypothetical protein